jgi:hypothetical protein
VSGGQNMAIEAILEERSLMVEQIRQLTATMIS